MQVGVNGGQSGGAVGGAGGAQRLRSGVMVRVSQSLVDGVKGASLVPLHVSDAPHRLDLRDLSSELCAVLVLALLKQVLEATVARVLVAHPAAARGGKRGRSGTRAKH